MLSLSYTSCCCDCRLLGGVQIALCVCGAVRVCSAVRAFHALACSRRPIGLCVCAVLCVCARLQRATLPLGLTPCSLPLCCVVLLVQG
jgi:hypothetical protein